jgi:protein-S-isoprenylcysteine O-methyltransferase Ste14
MLAILIRALTYTTLFVGVLLVYLPGAALARAGVSSPARIGAAQIAGATTTSLGAALCAWCILSFVFLGRGTPAPFDPPRRLVVAGPYRYVRNPMYVGAGAALLGAALFYQAPPLVAYAAGFLLVMHLFVVLHEEPTLRRTFGGEYAAYCRQARRWWPRL